MNQKFGSLMIDNVNRLDGKVYSLPNTGLTMRLVYNKDIFTKAGIQNPCGLAAGNGGRCQKNHRK